MIEYVLDRFENTYAILENTTNQAITNIDRQLLPPLAKEGDIITFDNHHYHLDHQKTQQSKTAMQILFARLSSQPT